MTQPAESTERILIFIPAYNEEGAIRNVVTGVRLAMPNADVLVIDDGSADHTSSAARAGGATVVRHPFNLGIGGAMQTGLKYAEQQGYDTHHAAPAVDLHPAIRPCYQLTVRKWQEHLARSTTAR